MVGDVERKELCALKRVGAIGGGGGGKGGNAKGSRQNLIIVPERVGRRIYTVYIMSDAYLGLDQQYDIRLNVVNDGEAKESIDAADDTNEIFYSDEEEMPTLNGTTTHPRPPPQSSSSAVAAKPDTHSRQATTFPQPHLDWTEEAYGEEGGARANWD